MGVLRFGKYVQEEKTVILFTHLNTSTSHESPILLSVSPEQHKAPNPLLTCPDFAVHIQSMLCVGVPGDWEVENINDKIEQDFIFLSNFLFVEEVPWR